MLILLLFRVGLVDRDQAGLILNIIMLRYMDGVEEELEEFTATMRANLEKADSE